MDPQQAPTSFIPKKSLTSDSAIRGTNTIGFFMLISLLIFIGSLVAAGAAFAYQAQQNKNLSDNKLSLQRSQSLYDPSAIQDLSRVDSRINNAETLLAKHVAASGVFTLLSSLTLASVSFSSFSYSVQPDGSAALKLDGQADSFSTVALQSDQLGASKSLKNVIFSNIQVLSGAQVGFTVDAVVVPSVVSYANTLNAAPPSASSQASTTP
jgi:hypothetical protein